MAKKEKTREELIAEANQKTTPDAGTPEVEEDEPPATTNRTSPKSTRSTKQPRRHSRSCSASTPHIRRPPRTSTSVSATAARSSRWAICAL
jgi:hypothetical protein